MGKAQDHVWRTEQPRKGGGAVAEGAGLQREEAWSSGGYRTTFPSPLPS